APDGLSALDARLRRDGAIESNPRADGIPCAIDAHRHFGPTELSSIRPRRKPSGFVDRCDPELRDPAGQEILERAAHDAADLLNLHGQADIVPMWVAVADGQALFSDTLQRRVEGLPDAVVVRPIERTLRAFRNACIVF